MSVAIRATLLLCVSLFIAPSQASITVGGTRLIYSGAENESAISVSNSKDSIPYLIQSWLEGKKGETVNIPFVVTPPLFRLDGGHENTLRVIYTGERKLPEDRESLFWLNVKSIPSMERSNQNRLLIAVNTRLKLFYRPEKLSNEKAREAWKQLKVTKKGGQIEIANPTPYYISLFSFTIGNKKMDQAPMISPFGTVSVSGNGREVFWKAINDYGGITQEAHQMLQ